MMKLPPINLLSLLIFSSWFLVSSTSHPFETSDEKNLVELNLRGGSVRRYLNSGNKSAKSPKSPKSTKSAKSKTSKSSKRCKNTDGTSPPDFIAVEDESSVLTSNIAPETVARCLLALQSSGFSHFDYEQYDKWFDDSSIAIIPDTGYYVGSENIKEYVSIFTESTAYKLFEEYFSDLEMQQLIPIMAEGNECTMTLYTKTSSFIAPLNDTITFVGGTKLHYTIVDDGPFPSQILVRQLDAVSLGLPC